MITMYNFYINFIDIENMYVGSHILWCGSVFWYFLDNLEYQEIIITVLCVLGVCWLVIIDDRSCVYYI